MVALQAARVRSEDGYGLGGPGAPGVGYGERPGLKKGLWESPVQGQ